MRVVEPATAFWVVLVGTGLLLPAAAPAQAEVSQERFGYCNINPNPVVLNGSEGSDPGSFNFSLTCHGMAPTTTYAFSSSLTGSSTPPKGAAACKSAGPGAGRDLKSDQFGYVSQYWTGNTCTPGRFTVTVAPAGGKPAVMYGLLIPSE